MVGIKKLGCLGVLSRKTLKTPKRMNLTRRVSGRTHIYYVFGTCREDTCPNRSFSVTKLMPCEVKERERGRI